MEVYFIILLIILVFSNILSFIILNYRDIQRKNKMQKSNLEYTTIKEKYSPTIFNFFTLGPITALFKEFKKNPNLNISIGNEIESGKIREISKEYITDEAENKPILTDFSIFKSNLSLKNVAKKPYKAIQYEDLITDTQIEELSDIHVNMTPFIEKEKIEVTKPVVVENELTQKIVQFAEKLPKNELEHLNKSISEIMTRRLIMGNNKEKDKKAA